MFKKYYFVEIMPSSQHFQSVVFYNSFRWLRLEDRLIVTIEYVRTPTLTSCQQVANVCHTIICFLGEELPFFAITRLTWSRRPDLLMNWNTFPCWLEFQIFLIHIFFYGNDCLKPKIGLLKKDSILHMIFKDVQHFNFIIGTWFFQMGFWKGFIASYARKNNLFRPDYVAGTETVIFTK